VSADGRTIELEILKLADGGDGFGRLDGKACFVPLAAPGDRVVARVTRETGSYLRADIERVVEAGPGRAEPICEAYGVCGGCNLMHLSGDAQLEAKAKTLLRILSGEVEIVHSPKPFGYRCLARMRYRPGPGEVGRLGFFGQRGRKLVDIGVCPVLEPAIEAVLPYLKDGPLESVGRPVDVRLVAGVDGPLALVESEHMLPARFYEAAALMVPNILAGVLASVDGVVSTIEGESHAILEGADGERLRVPVGGFGQANPGINRLIGQILCGWIADGGYRSAIELYAGAGNFTVGIAPLMDRMAAVELDADACRLMRGNLERRGLGRVEVVGGDALAGYREAGQGHELVVLDPPRSGARELCRAISRGDHRGVIYVSCDPATLGRDLSELKAGGYELVEARGFDMFPQTAHVETAVWLERV
jgi:23S rRNA (uracil1939-C5)-methyltransferase